MVNFYCTYKDRFGNIHHTVAKYENSTGFVYTIRDLKFD